MAVCINCCLPDPALPYPRIPGQKPYLRKNILRQQICFY